MALSPSSGRDLCGPGPETQVRHRAGVHSAGDEQLSRPLFHGDLLFEGERIAPRPGLAALQVLKAVCVTGMVAVHGFYWAATIDGRLALDTGTGLFQAVDSGMLVGVLPLLLPFTAGCALRVHWSGPAGVAQRIPIRQAATLAMMLAALGYLTNVLAAGWEALWGWNVLQFVGLSLVVIAVLVRAGSAAAVALAALVVLIASDPLRDWIPFWEGPGWVRILLGDPTDFHTWPFFPWFATIAFGWLVGHAVLRLGHRSAFRWALVFGGGGMTILAWAMGGLVPRFDPLNLIGPRIMQPPAVYSFGVIGLAALLTGGLAWIAPHLRTRRYGLVRCFSGGILWIYVVHLVVGVRISSWLDRHVNRSALLEEPSSVAALALLVGLPLFLLALSWLVGFLALRLLHEKRIRVVARRVRHAGYSTTPVP